MDDDNPISFIEFLLLLFTTKTTTTTTKRKACVRQCSVAIRNFGQKKNKKKTKTKFSGIYLECNGN